MPTLTLGFLQQKAHCTSASLYNLRRVIFSKLQNLSHYTKTFVKLLLE